MLVTSRCVHADMCFPSLGLEARDRMMGQRESMLVVSSGRNSKEQFRKIKGMASEQTIVLWKQVGIRLPI